MSDSVRPHRRQPTRLPHPWDSPGKNTGVGCHFLLQCMKVKSESEVAQLCPTLSDPMDCSLPGSSIHKALDDFNRKNKCKNLKKKWHDVCFFFYFYFLVIPGLIKWIKRCSTNELVIDITPHWAYFWEDLRVLRPHHLPQPGLPGPGIGVAQNWLWFPTALILVN